MPQAVKEADFQQSHVTESELDLPIWAVISFERVEATDLTYETASSLMNELEQRKVPGLCIVTNQTAERVKIQE